MLAVGDHLIRDLAEKAGHALPGAVVSRNGEHHLDVIHQTCDTSTEYLFPARRDSEASCYTRDRFF